MSGSTSRPCPACPGTVLLLVVGAEVVCPKCGLRLPARPDDLREVGAERPILFSGPMVRAILEGKKTQTRRLLKDGDLPFFVRQDGTGKTCFTPPGKLSIRGWTAEGEYGESFRRPPCWTGDTLWVREAWRMNTPPSGVLYRADDIADHVDGGWKPSIFMLDVTGVRVERLQEISEGDVEAEGIAWTDNGNGCSQWTAAGEWFDYPRDAYSWLWDSINGKRAPWESNPCVWVIEFRRIAP